MPTRTRTSKRFHLRLGLLVGLSMLLLPLGGVGVASAAPQAPTATPSQMAEAIATPSVVNVGVQWKAYVDFPSPIDLPGGITYTHTGWFGPYTVDSSCSGFIADATGYVVTAGHCVDNQSMTNGGKALLINAFMDEYKAKYPTAPAEELAALRQIVETNGRVEGLQSGSPPDRNVTVFLTNAATNPTVGRVANTVEFKPITEGDVALLKIEAPSTLPVLPVAPNAPPAGTDIVLGGYAGSVSGVVDANQQVSFKDGKTSSTQTVNGVPFTEVSAAATAGMSGGPAVDMQGRVIGTISFKPGGEAQQFNFVTGTSTLRSLLARNGVSNKLAAPDNAYRDGLTAFYGRHYHDAVQDFDQVLAVEPGNAPAQQYKQQAIQNYPNEVSTGPALWMWALIAVAAVLLIGGGTAFFLVRRRKKGAPTPPAAPYAVPTAVTPTAAPPPPPPPTAGAPPVAPPAAAPQPAPAEPATRVAEPVGGPAEPDGHPAGGDGHAGDGQARETAGADAAPAAPAPEQVFCPNCGTPHDPGSHFCVSCGTHFEETRTPPASRR